MSKNQKSIVVSYRLSPQVIAKAIDGLKTYDKGADIETLSAICKQTMLHGVNYLTQSLPWEPSQESQIIVHSLTTQGRRNKPSMENLILSSKLVFPQARHEEKEPISQSEKTIINDWSVSNDMKEKE